ncbi:hypothetical protein Ana3638_03975 [Anaerocolumna sedimenticola]|uniref:FMN-binding domain-containing protein n=1 Tax=Anaerocolumna sedimenticola TaxID=2696063 RepID=A0A6P1TIX0_9FIRM|nr:hypothetical protein [Anaerocolumna sedimenticola]QHQ60042.1 hypothetical protein Ana3638_03975 [Anaerocolumna sedimenticola]
MKKLSALLLSLILVVTMITGCGGKSSETSGDATTPTVEPTTAAETTEETATAEEAAATTEETASTGTPVKTGLAVINDISSSTSATADADGVNQTNSVVVAVTVGQDGKILDCKLDMAQTKINFSKEGKLTTPIESTFKSKQELGTDYGMKGSSGIGKEWNEQANAFADYVTGKTVDEVKGIALNEEGVATDADLASSVTVHIGDFIAAVEKAVANAQDLGATDADKLGLGVSTNMENSKDAAADADGVAQAYSYYIVTTSDAAGKITSCLIDASQGIVNFDATGKITNDITVAPQTKDELKEAYGMKKASGLGKEWYEEANTFAQYAVGKTVDELKGISVNEEGAPTTADLTSSVTIDIKNFVTSIEKAVANSAQ